MKNALTMIKYFDLQRLNEQTDGWQQAAGNVLQSGWYLQGEQTKRFEQAYAQYIGTRHCIGCGNGLDALTLILRAYIEMGRLHPGDEVIVPANTYIATILAVTENRLTPVLVEPDPDTLQIDDHLLQQSITPRTRAIMFVHLYGRCAMTELIADLCRRNHLLLIEDNAQAHGCHYTLPDGTTLRTGSLGDAAGHSFYPTKNLGAMGDAGAVTTNDDDLAAMVRSLGNYGSSRKYVFPYQGRNSRIDEVQAAILLAKLSQLDAHNERRRQIAAHYYAHIQNPHLRLPQSDRDCVWHIFPLFSPHRDRLQAYLHEQGIETQIHYPIPPHRQQCYAGLWPELSLPVTERLAAEELSLPCHPALTDAEVEQVVCAVNRFQP